MVESFSLQGRSDFDHVFVDRPEPIDRGMIGEHVPIFRLGEIMNLDARQLLTQNTNHRSREHDISDRAEADDQNFHGWLAGRESIGLVK